MPFFWLRSFMNSCAAQAAPTSLGRTQLAVLQARAGTRYSTRERCNIADARFALSIADIGNDGFQSDGGFTAALQSGVGAIEGGLATRDRQAEE